MSEKTQVFGLHAVQGFLTTAPERIETLWLDKGRRDQRIQAVAELASAASVELVWTDRKELDKLAYGARHQGALARIRARPPGSERDLERLVERTEKNLFLLVLDGVQDPHNLGACLRTADGAGVDAVIVPRDRACGLTPTVRKVATGAAETIPFIQVTNLARTLRLLHHAGIALVGTAGDASRTLYEAELTGSLALVLGAEEKGLRRLTREQCDLLVKIPMAGTMESLNVSVAAGVCLYEAVRQRLAYCE